MNAVEIEEAVSRLAELPFDLDECPFAFLGAFGNKRTTIQRLRGGTSNRSDLEGVLQTNNIHIAVAASGEVTKTLVDLKASPATTRAKAKFILATDGEAFEAEDLVSGETVACDYADFPNHFGFFLPLAGITTVKQIRENAFDIRATSRLNRLYVELLRDNPDWSGAERGHEMNHFVARLIFCFFAEDTDYLQWLGPGHSNGRPDERAGLVEHSRGDRRTVPRHEHQVGRSGCCGNSTLGRRLPLRKRRAVFRRHGRTTFQQDRSLIPPPHWQPRLDEDQPGHLWLDDPGGRRGRGTRGLGMHYTSAPNILKVLNPLFLDDLRARLEEAGDNSRMLLNLRRRMARIRVFDPACGSGNFLVIAYKEMRAIEAEINRRRREADRRSDIPPTNFRGIEIRDFPAEIARLALIIAEYQSDMTYRGQKEALQDFLPLDADNWITCGNALRLDWLTICPPTGTEADARVWADDLIGAPLDQRRVHFDNEGGETYICGNLPYLGSTWQTKNQKAELQLIFQSRTSTWKTLDYVAGWFIKAAEYGKRTDTAAAFVATNSVCQGQ